MKNYDLIIGIDPDVSKNGVCFLDLSQKRVKLASLTFGSVVDTILSLRGENRRVCVVVEAGWLNSGNWHLKYSDNKRVAAAKGRNTGANHETGKKIVELCRHFGVEVVELKPLKKIWKGADRKITHEELSHFVPDLPNRTNQEERDACLLSWSFAGLPIKIARRA